MSFNQLLNHPFEIRPVVGIFSEKNAIGKAVEDICGDTDSAAEFVLFNAIVLEQVQGQAWKLVGITKDTLG